MVHLTFSLLTIHTISLNTLCILRSTYLLRPTIHTVSLNTLCILRSTYLSASYHTLYFPHLAPLSLYDQLICSTIILPLIKHPRPLLGVARSTHSLFPHFFVSFINTNQLLFFPLFFFWLEKKNFVLDDSFGAMMLFEGRIFSFLIFLWHVVAVGDEFSELFGILELLRSVVHFLPALVRALKI